MGTPGQGSVSYQCPRCQAPLTAQVGNAGQRHQCPRCGKMVKVPGPPRAATTSRPPGPPQPPGTPRAADQPPAPRAAPDAPLPAAAVQRGIAHIAIVCPVCGTRMYATREQIGKTMVCPDCLETVTVPDAAAARPAGGLPRPARRSRSVPPAKTQPAAPDPADGDDPNDELKLGDPVAIPAQVLLPSHLAEALRDVPAPPQSDPSAAPTTAALPDAGTTPARPDLSQPGPAPIVRPQFAVKCPTCDTLIYATEDEIGQRRTCPDCLSPIEIKRPRPKPRRVNEVVDTDYEGALFTLSDPVPLDIHHCTERGLAPRTEGEDALRRAEQEYERRRQGEPSLPPIPLWDGLFRFLPDLPMLVRLLLTGLALGSLMRFTVLVVRWAHGSSPIEHLATMLGMLSLVLLTTLCFTYVSTTCLLILQESAHGQDRITDWPAMGLGDRLAESLSVAAPALYAVLPGLAFFLASWTAGLSLTACCIFPALSLYLFFPIVQLSALESGSLMMPVSQLILKSLNTDFLLWCTLYLMNAALGLIVALTTLGLLRTDQTLPVCILVGLVWTLALFLFYRLLGRLAWACQERFLERFAKKTANAKSPGDAEP